MFLDELLELVDVVVNWCHNCASCQSLDCKHQKTSTDINRYQTSQKHWSLSKSERASDRSASISPHFGGGFIGSLQIQLSRTRTKLPKQHHKPPQVPRTESYLWAIKLSKHIWRMLRISLQSASMPQLIYLIYTSNPCLLILRWTNNCIESIHETIAATYSNFTQKERMRINAFRPRDRDVRVEVVWCSLSLSTHLECSQDRSKSQTCCNMHRVHVSILFPSFPLSSLRMYTNRLQPVTHHSSPTASWGTISNPVGPAVSKRYLSNKSGHKLFWKRNFKDAPKPT